VLEAQRSLFSFQDELAQSDPAVTSNLRPLQNAPFCPIPASGSNFNPQNTQCIPVVKIIAFLGLEQNWTFFKSLNLI